MKLINWTPSQDLIATFPEFSRIRVYGTAERPLFHTGDVETMLGLGRQQYARDYQLDKDYVKATIVRDDNRPTEYNLLTTRGLYTLAFKGKTEVADRFKDFVTIVLDELRLHGEVTLKTALGKLEQQLDEEHARYLTQQKLSERYHMQLYDANCRMLELKGRAQQLTEWGRGSAEYRLQQVKEKLFKKAYVYVEPVPKQLADVIEPYPDDEPHETDDRIMSVSFTKRERSEVGIAYVPPSTKQADIETALKPWVLDYRTNRYHCSLEDIATALDAIEI